MLSQHLRLPGLVLAAVILGCSISCSNKPTDGDPGGTQSFSVSPGSAAPAQRVAISGYSVPPAGFSGYTVRVGPVETPVVNDGSGGLWFYAPVVFDSTTLWHEPPTGAVDVVLLQHGIDVASASGAFTYQALPRAPGTTRRTMEDLTALVASLEVLALNFSPDSTVAQGVLLSAKNATDSLLSDPEGIALLDAIDAFESDSVVIGLMDAIYASSRVSEYVADYLTLLESPQPQPIRSLSTPDAAIALYFTVDDYDLATLMQVGSVVGNFGTNFLDGLSGEIGSLGPVGSFIKKVSEAAPYLKDVKHPVVENGQTVLKSVKEIMGRIETVVAILEFVINRIVASVVPTEIDSIRIAVDPDSLRPGDLTDSLTGTVYASNSPDSATFGEVVDWTLEQLGELAGDPKSRRESMATNVNKWLDWFKSFMDKYAADAGISWDRDAFTLFKTPDIFWDADVVTPTLYGLVSSDQAKMDQYLGALTWKAEPDAVGSVDLWITPSDNLANLNIATPPGVAYTGGTFGDNFRSSNKEKVFIGDPLHIEAGLPPYLMSGQTGNVTFRVGVTDGSGGYTWLNNVDLSISALFGYVGASTGKTDANGEFTTTATKNLIGSNGVEITVEATDSKGRTGEGTFTVPYLGDLLLDLGFPNEPGYPHTIGDPAAFAVRAGHIVTGGQIDYLPDIDIFLTVNNGVAAPSSGKTDSAGFVFSSISFGSGQDSLMIYVSATGREGISALDSTYALKVQPARARVYHASHFGFYEVAAGVTGDCDDSTAVPCDDYDKAPPGEVYQLNYGETVSSGAGCQGATSDASATGDATIDATPDSLFSQITVSVQVNTNATVLSRKIGSALGQAAYSHHYWFEVTETVVYNIQGTLGNGGNGSVFLAEIDPCFPQPGCFGATVEEFVSGDGSFTAAGTLIPGHYRFRVVASTISTDQGNCSSEPAADSDQNSASATLTLTR